MNSKHKQKFKKKLAVKEQREKLADIFIYQFIIAIGLCIVTFVDIQLFAGWPRVMHQIHFWTLWTSLIVTLTAFIIQLRLKEATAMWVIWVKRWSFMVTLGTGIIYIHTILGKISWAWWDPIKKFMKFGNEGMSLRWMFAYIGIGLLVCFVIFAVKDYELVRQKRKLKKDKNDDKTDKK